MQKISPVSFQYEQKSSKSISKSVYLPIQLKIILISSIFTVILLLILVPTSFSAIQHINDMQSKINRHLPIYSGQIQYCRLPRQYWQHRLQLIKDMGMNSISVYVMWNFHQTQKGIFDFQTQNKNLTAFLQLTQKYKLKVLFRPGPYVCAQWDFGGLPVRFLGDQNIQIRSSNKYYQNQVYIYFKALSQIIRPFLQINGGNIIMIQIQNQLGYIRNQNRHTLNLINMWKTLNINSQFYIQDPAIYWKNQYIYIPGIHIALSQTSFMLRYFDIDLSPHKNKQSLIFGGEVYGGWFTDWGYSYASMSTDKITQKIKIIKQNNRSFSLYMAYGGTNFGLSAGANGFNLLYDYMPHITSYDYDSPISQNGKTNQKYQKIKSILNQANNKQSNIKSIKTIIIQPFLPTYVNNLWNNLPQITLYNNTLTYFQSDKLKMYNQGLVLYQTILKGIKKYIFRIYLRDFGLIYLNKQYIKTIRRQMNVEQYLQITCQFQQCQLRILVQAMGHINFGPLQGQDKKGLIIFYQIHNSQFFFVWNITKIPIHDSHYTKWTQQKFKQQNKQGPFLYKKQIELNETGDVYFDLSKYGKGYLTVNNRLLGRYWNIGPQERLYCPGVWLKKGINQIYIFELLQKQAKIINTFQNLI